MSETVTYVGAIFCEKWKLGYAGASLRCIGTILDDESQDEYLVETLISKHIKSLRLEVKTAEAWFFFENKQLVWNNCASVESKKRGTISGSY